MYKYMIVYNQNVKEEYKIDSEDKIPIDAFKKEVKRCYYGNIDLEIGKELTINGADIVVKI